MTDQPTTPPVSIGALVGHISRAAARLEIQEAMVGLARAWASEGAASDKDVLEERRKADQCAAELAAAVATLDQEWGEIKRRLTGVDPLDEARASVFTETGAYLNDEALKAFLEGMKDTRPPTQALIDAMRLSKSIRQADSAGPEGDETPKPAADENK